MTTTEIRQALVRATKGFLVIYGMMNLFLRLIVDTNVDDPTSAYAIRIRFIGSLVAAIVLGALLHMCAEPPKLKYNPKKLNRSRLGIVNYNIKKSWAVAGGLWASGTEFTNFAFRNLEGPVRTIVIAAILVVGAIPFFFAMATSVQEIQELNRRASATPGERRHINITHSL